MTGNRTKRGLKWVQFPAVGRLERLSNPYCGLYSIYRFFAHSDTGPETGKPIEQTALMPDQSLCLVEINLVGYNLGPLSEEALTRVRRIFAFFAGSGREMIVRFVYDWDGNGIQHEPKEIDIILAHMRQLSPLLKEYTVSIYILQGLFTGSWGEMHSTRYASERSLLRLAQQLYECSGEHTFIALRCPSIWRTVFRTYEPLDGLTAYTDAMRARFGLFNDGILASDTDNGTYGTALKGLSAGYGDKFTRYEELIFQDRLCTYVPNGGETVGGAGDLDFTALRRDFAQMHVSYLNSNYDLEVLNKWKVCKTGGKGGPWKQLSVYDYIAAHLGYRYCLVKTELSGLGEPAEALRIRLQVRNTGFSCAYRRFDVALVVRTADYETAAVCPVDTDTRQWLPDKTVTLEVQVPCAQWGRREHVLCLRITDPLSRKPIRLANTFAPADYAGLHSLGCIQLGDN